MQVRQVYYRVLKLLLFMLTPVMLWVGLMVLTNCNMPVLVVTSGDLYPSFLNRGDVLFLTNYKEEPIRVGEIVVFKVEGRDIPIVHRVLKVHEKENGTVKILTKGDNNIVDDRGLYPPGKFWLERRDIVGVVKGYVSYLGIAAIILQENRMVKGRGGNLASKSTKVLVTSSLNCVMPTASGLWFSTSTQIMDCLLG